MAYTPKGDDKNRGKANAPGQVKKREGIKGSAKQIAHKKNAKRKKPASGGLVSTGPVYRSLNNTGGTIGGTTMTTPKKKK